MTRSTRLLGTATAMLVAVTFTGSAGMAANDEGAASTTPRVVSASCETFADDPAVSETVTVAKGTLVVLRLCSNPTTGYLWSEPVSSDPVVASVGSWDYEAPSGDLDGAGGAEHMSIVTSAPGSAVITASYGQPWEGGDTSDWSIELTVEVLDASQLAISCEEFGETPDVATSVDLAAGSSLVLSLCSNPTTGFQWDDAESSDPGIASVDGWVFEAPMSEPGIAGEPGTEHLTIDAHAAGTAVVTASYDQSWDGGEKGAWSLKVTVNVD